MEFDENQIRKYLSEASNHFKINKKPKLVMEYEKPKTKLDEITPARYNSTTNEIIFLPLVFNKYGCENLRWLSFHEVGHVKEGEINGRNKFFFWIYNLDFIKIPDDEKEFIKIFFNEFSDWSVNNYLHSIKMPIPNNKIKQAIKNIDKQKNNKQMLNYLSRKYCIEYLSFLQYGVFKNKTEQKKISKILNLFTKAPVILKLLNQNRFKDHKIKIKTFPKIFEIILKYTLIVVKIPVSEIKLKCNDPDYLILKDDDNSIWTTYKLEKQ